MARWTCGGAGYRGVKHRSDATTQTATGRIWYVVPTGASVNWSRADGRSLTLLQPEKVTRRASVSGRRLSSSASKVRAAPLLGQTVTVEAQGLQ